MQEAIPPKLYGGTERVVHWLTVAFNRGSVPEVVDDGLTGFIVEDEKGAIGAFGRLTQLSREKIRMQFERRFTARRMAQEYLALYRSLMDRTVSRLRLVIDGGPALQLQGPMAIRHSARPGLRTEDGCGTAPPGAS